MGSQETQHLVKARTEAKIMYLVDAYSPERAAEYAEKMVQRRTKGWGDETNALGEVSRWCGMSAISLKRLIKRETKTINSLTFGRIRGAYLDYCARQISELQHEIEVEKARIGGDDTFADLAAEAELLAAKVERARKGNQA